MPASQTSVATLTNVTHRYGSIEALSDVTLDLEAGQVTALLGPNGAGKTTIVRLLTGLTRPTTGDGRPLRRRSAKRCEARRRLGRDAAGRARARDADRVGAHHLFSCYYPSPLPLPTVLRLAGLESVADRRYGKLSGGQQQRTLFALAVCGNPGLLFLDEPTVGMDVESRRQFWSTIRELAASGPVDPADDPLSRGGRRAGDADRRVEPRPRHCRRHAGHDQAAGGGPPDSLPHALERGRPGALPGVQRAAPTPTACASSWRPTRIARCGRSSRPTSLPRTSRSGARASRKHSSRSPAADQASAVA